MKFLNKPKKLSRGRSSLKPRTNNFKSGFGLKQKINQQKSGASVIKVQKAKNWSTAQTENPTEGTQNKRFFGNLNSFRPVTVLNKIKNLKPAVVVQYLSLKMAQLLGILLLVTILYLSFFDTNYVVKNWQLNMAPGSYLDATQQKNIVTSFQNSRLLGIFPSNEYWFLTEPNLTYLAFDNEPSVKKIQIQSRQLPDQATLLVTTQPILATIGITVGDKQEYWRIAKDGEIISRDMSNQYEKLISVDKSISYDQARSDFRATKIFTIYPSMLNKVYFALFAQNLLNQYSTKVVSLSLSSLNVADNGISLTLENGTRIIFDARRFDQATLEERVRAIFDSELKDQIDSGSLSYVDLRIPRRVFICPKTKPCTNRPI